MALPRDASLIESARPELLGGVFALEAHGEALTGTGPLYTSETKTTVQSAVLTLVPYYAWANRAPGTMTVWLKETK